MPGFAITSTTSTTRSVTLRRRFAVIVITLATLAGCDFGSRDNIDHVMRKADDAFQEQLRRHMSTTTDLNDIQSFAGYENRPVIIAALGCLEHSMHLLLSNGADPNAVDIQTGWSALHCLSAHPTCPTARAERIAKTLIRHGANLNMRASNGTALHMAVRNNRGTLATTLVESGADVAAIDDDAATPLHWAAFQGEAEVAELLIKYGADVNAKARNGTPLSYFYMRTREDVQPDRVTAFDNTLTLLREHGAY